MRIISLTSLEVDLSLLYVWQKARLQCGHPIFEQNKDNVIETLDAYIQNLEHFKSLLVKDDYEALFLEMKNTNQLTSILNGISKK